MKRNPPRAKEPQLVGTISLVSVNDNFVLIDGDTRLTPGVGTLLRNQPATGIPAEMRVTEIRKRPFVIADIVSGEPQKGDLVYEYPAAK